MAFRSEINLTGLRSLRQNLDKIAAPILQDCLETVQQQAVQNLSGIPFTSKTGTHTIQKRSGVGAASVRVQYPYGSPFAGRVFANAQTRYANNPESYNYLSILERGRGEIRPKYTPAMRGGFESRARLAVPGGGNFLVQGQNGFRGGSGNYRFVKRIPPMEGKYWLDAAAQKAQEQFSAIASDHIAEFLSQ